MEINNEKSKYTSMLSCHQNAGQNRNIKIATRSSENVAKFKYLRMIVTDQNLFHYKIKCRLNLGNACCHSVQNILSSSFLSKIRIKMHETMIFPVLLNGCETCFVTIMKKH
jgi:hypothetical protein